MDPVILQRCTARPADPSLAQTAHRERNAALQERDAAVRQLDAELRARQAAEERTQQLQHKLAAAQQARWSCVRNCAHLPDGLPGGLHRQACRCCA